MFKTKKKLQRELRGEQKVSENLRVANERLAQRIFEHKVEHKELRKKCDAAEQALAQMIRENEVLRENSASLERSLERTIAALRKRESIEQDVHTLIAERDELLRANGDLKREADRQSQENARLAEQLMRMACPEDCAGHTYTAPGGTYCRACIRNPHARDKYMAVEQ